MASELDRHYHERMIYILKCMAIENTGWRGFFRRWYYSHEPLRNDAANLLREMKYRPILRYNTRLVGEKPDGK